MAQYKVQGPDGRVRVLEGPDGATDAQVQEAAAAAFGPQEVGLGQRLKNVATDLGRGALKTIDMIGEGLEGANLGPSVSARSARTVRPPDPIADAAITPRTPTGRIDALAQAATEGAAGAALTGPGALPKMGLNAVIGAMSGLGGKVGENMTSGSPIGSVLGSLVGAMGPSGYVALKNISNAPALARKGIAGISDANLDVARQRMVDAQKILPTGINAAQAMHTPSNLDDLIVALSHSADGGVVSKQLRDQPEQLAILGRMAQADLPGNRQSAAVIANRSQDAATEIINDLRSQRTAATQPLIEKARQLPEAVNAQMVGEIEAALKRKGATPEFLSGANRLLAQMVESPRTGQPTRMPQDVQAYLESFSKGVKEGGLRGNPTTEAQVDFLTRRLRGMLEANSPQIGKASAVYRDLTENTINPVKKSIIGDIAGVTGANPERSATQNKLYDLFNRGTVNVKDSEINTIEAALRKQDPTLFPDAVASHIADKMNKVLPVPGAPVSQYFAENVKRELAGTPAQYQGLRDQLAGVARSQGVAEGPVVKGFMNFIDAAIAAEKRPGSVSTLPASGIEEIAGASKVAGVFGSATPGRISTKISNYFSKDAKKKIDALLTTPEGLDRLRALAKVDPKGQQAQVLLAAMFGNMASAGNPAQ